jgi:HK97 family phage prohead protease
MLMPCQPTSPTSNEAPPLLEVASEVKFCKLDLKDVSLDGAFEGYASLFDREDLGRDVIKPGAFRTSLGERGASGVKMLFQHDAGEPIGVWQKIHEDARGLFARGRLMTDVARAREVLALMRAGAVDGLSIGFRAVQSRRDRRTGIRYLTRIDLWEISIVTFPMQPDARITTVKATPFGGAVPSEREFERWLTQDAGFSRSQARSIIRGGLKGLRPRQDAGHARAGDTRLKRQIEEAANLLRSAQSSKPNFEVSKW